MTDKIEKQGKTVEEAVNEALLQMGARKDEVSIEVLEEPRSGLFGIIGGKRARVLVTRKEGGNRRSRGRSRNHTEDQVVHDLSENDGSKRGRGRGRRSQPAARKDDGDTGRGGDSRRGRSSRRGGRRDGEAAGAQNEGGRSEGGRNEGGRSDRRSGEERSEQTRSRRGGRGRNRQDARQDGGQDGRQDGRRQDRSRREDGRQDGNRQDGSRQDGNRQEAAPGRDEGRDSRGSRRRRGGRSRRNDPDRGGRSRRDQEQDGAAAMPDSPVTENVAQDSGAELAGNRQQEASSGNDRNRRDERPRGEGRGRGRGRSRRSRDRDADDSSQDRGSDRRESPAAASVGSDQPSRTEQNMTPDQPILAGISAVKYADPVRNVAEENLDQTLVDLTSGMLIRAGFPIRCEVKAGDYRQVRVVTDDSSAGMLIGRHGATVDAIEHLVERMAGMAAGDRVRMNLDINNYRRRREESLYDRVAEAADLVLDNGRTYHMEPMCARERRIVHLQVEKIEGLRTFTMGGAGGKHVVIALEGEEGSEKEKGSESDVEVGQDADESVAAAATDGDDFEEIDDGPQPETNELVVDDDEPRPLI